jgi:hypothetical protein
MTLINELVANSDILSTKVGENAYKIDEVLELLHKHCPEFKSAVDGDRISKVIYFILFYLFILISLGLCD